MSWLFWILLAVFVLSIVQGIRKGMVRTAISMVSFLLVLLAVSWLNPYVSGYIRENTQWQESIEKKTAEMLENSFQETPQWDQEQQEAFIQELPMPELIQKLLTENNTAEKYQALAAETFAEYISGYLAYGIVNGIAFVISFIIATILIRLILYAVDVLTQLPVIHGLNRLGGGVLGAVQGILWIWIIFLVITVLYDTSAGRVLMDQIMADPVLTWIYNRNLLLYLVMRVLGGMI